MAVPSLTSKIWTGAALIVACFAVGYFVTTKTYNDYAQAQVQLDSVKQKNVRLNQEQAAVQNFLNAFQTHTKDATTLNLALPAKSTDLSNFTASLGELARQSGLTLSGFQIEQRSTSDKLPPDNTIQKVEISLTAGGSYPSFKDFVLRLENHFRLVDISHINAKSDDTGNIQYNISFQTYYQQ